MKKLITLFTAVLLSQGLIAQTMNNILLFKETGNANKAVSPKLIIHNSNNRYIELKYNIENAIVSNKKVNGLD